MGGDPRGLRNDGRERCRRRRRIVGDRRRNRDSRRRAAGGSAGVRDQLARSDRRCLRLRRRAGRCGRGRSGQHDADARAHRVAGGGDATPPPTTTRPAAPAWLCPIATPVRFADTYGEGRDGGRAHLGVDLTAPMGTPTVAPVSGSVRYSRDSAGGLSWHLDGDDGVYYYGTHLSKFGSATGRVDQGTVIGYVGMTGNASMPHLHLEIHPGGISKKAINPTPTAAKYCNNTL